MVSLFLLLGCNLNYIVDLFAALHELVSASTRTLLKLASSVRALLKPYGDTLSTTTGATTTAYRKQIFCSGHAQKLNNWLQPAVVFTLATPHSLFWRSADNVAVDCKVFSPFFDLPFFFVRHIMKDLSGVYCQTFFEEKFYNEHPWGRKIR